MRFLPGRNRRDRKLALLCAVLGVATLLGCELSQERGGTFSAAFSFRESAPMHATWVYARIEQARGARRVQLAEAQIVRFQPDVELSFPSVQHGSGYVAVIEIKDAANKRARTLYFGESKPFSLKPGKHTKVDVALALAATPSTGTDRDAQTNGVEILEANTRGYVRERTVTLSLAARDATHVIAANDFAFSKGRRQVALAELPRDVAHYLWKGWDLDAGLCAKPPCPDEARSVYVQFVNEQGYASDVANTKVELDRVPPSLAAASLAPTLAKIGSNVTLVLNPSEPLARAPTLRVTPRDPGFSAFKQVSGGGYLCEHTVTASDVRSGPLAFSIDMLDLAGHRTSAALTETLVVDAKAPELVAPTKITPASVRDGDTFRVEFELDESLDQLPVVRVANTPIACAWVGTARRAVRCEHTATKAAGGGDEPIEIEARDGAGNIVTLAGGTVFYDTLPRCGNGETDALEGCDRGLANADVANSECRSNCQPRRCGDAIVDDLAGELCDDGNVSSGDGCSFDCRSTETCPNGYVDFVRGEQCDDGNEQSHDGCLSSCLRESPRWTPYTPVSFYGGAAAAYDAARGKVVLFGAVEEGLNGAAQTWEWDGGRWTLRAMLGSAPSVRTGHAMAYDAARAKTVLFGGYDGGYYDDTWEWNGASWQEIAVVGPKPPARSSASMVYDSRQGKVLLFGGDLWEWNGSSWREIAVGNPWPTLSAGHAMGYDPVRGRVVLHGLDSEKEIGETWEWDGNRWSRRAAAPALIPGARRHHAMAYDAKLGRMLLFGGRTADADDQEVEVDELWQWDGQVWTPILPSGAKPLARSDHAMAYDVARQRLVLAAGHSDNLAALPPSADYRSDTLGDTWEWDGLSWHQAVLNPVTPTPRRDHALAYDAGRGQVVWFGGGLSANKNETWEWNGAAWAERFPSGTLPEARAGHALAYDALRRRVVLFGGLYPYAPLPNSVVRVDTWEWDGTVWNEKPLSGALPLQRKQHAMAYDAARNLTVLFGGWDDLKKRELGDTWLWDGASWSQAALNGPAPSRRQDHALAYDAARQRTVLFGGSAEGSYYDDTWEWDGTSWALRSPSGPVPSKRDLHAMAYDATRGRVVLFGGDEHTGAALRGDAWEWDGTRWSPLTIAGSSPAGRVKHAMAYDAARRAMLLFGGDGSTSGSTPTKTWTFRYESVAQDEACHFERDTDGDGLIGCADPDCFGFCSPLCNPALMTCDAAWPHCGDGQCTAVESCRLCPDDCPCADPICGDFLCEAPEDAAQCPGDCTL